MKGIIFDFNGTMFLDSHLHEAAWLHMIHDHTKDGLSDEDILKNIHGRTNTEILKHFISEHLTASEIAVLSEEKESYYRMLCLQNENELQLTKGLEATLDQLTDQQIPLTIATATGKDWDKIVYDDGSFPGKPQPDIFLKAADKLSLAPADCLVIEDAYSGLLAAKRAGIGTIIAIDPFGKNKTVFEQAQLNKDGTIKDFTGFWTEHLSATSVNS